MRTLGLVCALVGEPSVHVAIEPGAAAELAPAHDTMLEEWLESRLVEEGWTIAEEGDAEVELRIVARQGTLFVEVAMGERVHAVEIPRTDDGLARLEMLHHAIAALEVVTHEPAANEPTPAVAVVPTTASTPAPAIVDVTPAPAAKRRTLGLRVHARAGAVGRRDAADAAVSAGVRIGRVPGPALRFELGVMPPRPTHGLAIAEVTPTLGFGWSFAVHRRVQIEPMFLAGVLMHVWRFDRMRQTVIDGDFEVPVELAVTLGRGFQFLVVPTFGAATRAREHVVAGRTIWSRGALRGGLSIGLAWGAEYSR